MKRILSSFLVLFLTFLPSPVWAYSEYALFIKDGFGWSSSALVITRESRYGQYGYFIIEYWIWCGLRAWRYEGGLVVVNTWTSSFLDGISDHLILPSDSNSSTCRIWNVSSLQDEIDNLDAEDIKWLFDNDVLR